MQPLWNKREKLKNFFLLYQSFVFCEDLAGLTSLSPNWVILLACYWRCCWRSCWGPVQKSDQSMCWSDRKLVKALKPASPKSSTARWVMGKERMVWCDEWFWGSSVAGGWNENGAQKCYTAYFCYCFHQQRTPSGWTAFALLQSPAVSHFALVWSFSPLTSSLPQFGDCSGLRVPKFVLGHLQTLSGVQIRLWDRSFIISVSANFAEWQAATCWWSSIW